MKGVDLNRLILPPEFGKYCPAPVGNTSGRAHALFQPLADDGFGGDAIDQITLGVHLGGDVLELGPLGSL